MNIVGWIKSKFLGRVYGADVKIVRNLGIIKVDCGRMPVFKAEDHVKKMSEVMLNSGIKEALGVSHLLFIPVTRD